MLQHRELGLPQRGARYHREADRAATTFYEARIQPCMAKDRDLLLACTDSSLASRFRAGISGRAWLSPLFPRNGFSAKEHIFPYRFLSALSPNSTRRIQLENGGEYVCDSWSKRQHWTRGGEEPSCPRAESSRRRQKRGS